mmetsp:Transcript_36009/g.93672  ORF Transcript_36009/g.93672 Transcript_36009/m.93672 type:complete len:96 (+) Transcript_36009:268-555(+)
MPSELAEGDEDVLQEKGKVINFCLVPFGRGPAETVDLPPPRLPNVCFRAERKASNTSGLYMRIKGCSSNLHKQLVRKNVDLFFCYFHHPAMRNRK